MNPAKASADRVGKARVHRLKKLVSALVWDIIASRLVDEVNGTGGCRHPVTG